jgi:hypothetical protein
MVKHARRAKKMQLTKNLKRVDDLEEAATFAANQSTYR